MLVGQPFGPVPPDHSENWDMTPQQWTPPPHFQFSDDLFPAPPSLDCNTIRRMIQIKVWTQHSSPYSVIHVSIIYMEQTQLQVLHFIKLLNTLTQVHNSNSKSRRCPYSIPFFSVNLLRWVKGQCFFTISCFTFTGGPYFLGYYATKGVVLQWHNWEVIIFKNTFI